jgi:hypothetical protein
MNAKMPNNSSGSRPVPDPTSLTTQQTDERVLALRELLETRIKGIDTQIAERDIRTEQTSRDSKVAVDAAFAAAKEAVAEQNKSNALSISKSEAAFTKQVDQMGIVIQALTKGIDDRIDDIKTRLTTIETSRSTKTDGVSQIGVVILGLFTSLSAIASVAAVVISITHH